MLNLISENAEQKFREDVSQFLQPRNVKGLSLLNFIKRRIRQWNLNEITSEDVLHDAILRGLRYTQASGQRIHCPEAWLRIVSLGILKNLVRKNVRRKNLSMELFPHDAFASNENIALKMEQEDLSTQLATQLAQALKALSAEDQEILAWYFYKDMTYSQIQDYYRRMRDEIVSLDVIRKRVSRAKERATKAFHELNVATNLAESIGFERFDLRKKI